MKYSKEKCLGEKIDTKNRIKVVCASRLITVANSFETSRTYEKSNKKKIRTFLGDISNVLRVSYNHTIYSSSLV